MKKILFVLPTLTVGGLEKAQITLANALVENKYDVTVMVLENRLNLKDELDKRVHLVYKPYKPHKIMRHIPYVRHKFYDDGMWETGASAKALYKYYVGKEKYDVEIAYFRGLPIKIISGSNNKSSKKLAWVHSDFKHCAGITNNFKNMDEAKYAYSKFDNIVCVSNQVKLSFDQVIGFKDKTVVINNIIPADKILQLSTDKADIDKKDFTIVSVGHLIKLKGYDRLLSAVLRLRKQGYKISLWLIGDGSDSKSLKEFAKINNMSYVSFLGMQENPYKYLSRADLYACSSLYEGYPTTVCEAVICGIPVLSTDCSGSHEILSNDYGIITDNSEQGLYEGIKQILDNRNVLELIKNKLPERKAYFDKQNILRKIEELL